MLLTLKLLKIGGKNATIFGGKNFMKK